MSDVRIQELNDRGQMHRPKVKVRWGRTSPFVPSSQTFSKFGYDLRDLGDSESVGDARPIRERSKIEEGSEEAIYVISVEDSEGPLEELWRLFAYEHEGSILIEKLARSSARIQIRILDDGVFRAANCISTSFFCSCNN